MTKPHGYSVWPLRIQRLFDTNSEAAIEELLRIMQGQDDQPGDGLKPAAAEALLVLGGSELQASFRNAAQKQLGPRGQVLMEQLTQAAQDPTVSEADRKAASDMLGQMLQLIPPIKQG